jgi:deoxyribose-phosphate aldolase
MAPVAREELASLIDHTLLRPDATAADVEALCGQAVRLGVHAVCVSPNLVDVAARCAPQGLAVASVCAFPSGAHRPEVKAFEAARAVRDGADEIDMVVDLGLVRSGQFDAVRAEVAGVVSAGAGALVKVIIEAAALDPEQIAAVCRAAVDAGAGFVKTSTGFHPAGGASVEAVRLMRSVVGADVGVKASGGIRTTEQALAMVAAGATRLGCSATQAILGGAAS